MSKSKESKSASGVKPSHKVSNDKSAKVESKHSKKVKQPEPESESDSEGTSEGTSDGSSSDASASDSDTAPKAAKGKPVSTVSRNKAPSWRRSTR